MNCYGISSIATAVFEQGSWGPWACREFLSQADSPPSLFAFLTLLLPKLLRRCLLDGPGLQGGGMRAMAPLLTCSLLSRSRLLRRLVEGGRGEVATNRRG